MTNCPLKQQVTKKKKLKDEQKNHSVACPALTPPLQTVSVGSFPDEYTKELSIWRVRLSANDSELGCDTLRTHLQHFIYPAAAA